MLAKTPAAEVPDFALSSQDSVSSLFSVRPNLAACETQLANLRQVNSVRSVYLLSFGF